jgi:hypothetical protein
MADEWKQEIDPSKDGAGYFLTQQKGPLFITDDYIAFRNMPWPESRALVIEWTSWLLHFRNSAFDHVHQKVISADTMTFDDIFEFHRKAIHRNHELEMLKESSAQILTTARSLRPSVRGRGRGTWYVGTNTDFLLVVAVDVAVADTYFVFFTPRTPSPRLFDGKRARGRMTKSRKSDGAGSYSTQSLNCVNPLHLSFYSLTTPHSDSHSSIPFPFILAPHLSRTPA